MRIMEKGIQMWPMHVNWNPPEWLGLWVRLLVCLTFSISNCMNGLQEEMVLFLEVQHKHGQDLEKHVVHTWLLLHFYLLNLTWQVFQSISWRGFWRGNSRHHATSRQVATLQGHHTPYFSTLTPINSLCFVCTCMMVSIFQRTTRSIFYHCFPPQVLK